MEATPADPGDPPNTFGISQRITSAKLGDTPGYTRVPAPKVEGGARRIGIQIGHWMTDNVPPELRRRGYLSNDSDRELAMDHADVLATGIANGVERFLSEVPSTELFNKDLLLPPTRQAFPDSAALSDALASSRAAPPPLR